MATFVYDSVDFATTLGALPRVSRDITREVEAATGSVLRELHVITCEWTAVPAAGSTLAQAQAAITAFEAVVEALDDGGILKFSDNAANVCWAYDAAAGTANNHTTAFGVKLTRKSFPWGPAKHVTNDPIRLTFEAVVIPCSNDPISGVGTLTYQVHEEYDLAGLLTVEYTGQLCACSGYNVRDIFATLRDTVFTPDARDKFTSAGATLGVGFGPSGQGLTYLDADDHCLQFRLIYGGGAAPQGLEATRLEVSVTCAIKQNLVTLQVTGRYHFRGDYIGTGSPIGTLFGIGASSGGMFAVPAGGFGLGGVGASSFDAVYREAWAFAGIDVRPFLPPGAGASFMTTDPVVTVDTDSNVITSTKTFYANWIWDSTILEYDETVELHIARPGTSERRQMYSDAGAPDPLVYIQESGLDAYRVTFSATIVARLLYVDLPDRLTADRVNIWRVSPDSMTASSKSPNQKQNPGLVREGYVTSRVVQGYIVRDPSAVPALKQIVVGSIARLATLGGSFAPVTSGGRALGVI